MFRLPFCFVRRKREIELVAQAGNAAAAMEPFHLMMLRQGCILPKDYFDFSGLDVKR